MMKTDRVQVTFKGESNQVTVEMHFFVSEALTAYDIVLGIPSMRSLERQKSMTLQFLDHAMTMRGDDGAIVKIPFDKDSDQPRRLMHNRQSHILPGNSPHVHRALEEEARERMRVLDKPLDCRDRKHLAVEMDIHFKQEPTPFPVINYHMSEDDREDAAALVKDLLARGVIKPSTSPFVSPSFIIRKKTLDPLTGKRKARLIHDFRHLNSLLKGSREVSKQIHNILINRSPRRIFPLLRKIRVTEIRVIFPSRTGLVFVRTSTFWFQGLGPVLWPGNDTTLATAFAQVRKPNRSVYR
jgi:hypothetical protein